MEKVRAYLKQDPKLIPLVDQLPLAQISVEEDVYFFLLRSVAGQQLSVKAAGTIWLRFLAAFPNDYPTPQLLIAKTPEELRALGLSKQKAGYMQNIAAFSATQELSNSALKSLDDRSIIELLAQIKGVGKWTVQMVLMSALGREDVFPVDDLGIRQAMIALYGVKSTGKALNEELTVIAEPWSPYRTYACRLLWQWKDGIANPVKTKS